MLTQEYILEALAMRFDIVVCIVDIDVHTQDYKNEEEEGIKDFQGVKIK